MVTDFCMVHMCVAAMYMFEAKKRGKTSTFYVEFFLRFRNWMYCIPTGMDAVGNACAGSMDVTTLPGWMQWAKASTRSTHGPGKRRRSTPLFFLNPTIAGAKAVPES